MENTHTKTNRAPAYIKVMAFLFPLFVMYGPVNDEVEHPANQQLWKYILAGLIAYVTTAMVLAFRG